MYKCTLIHICMNAEAFPSCMEKACIVAICMNAGICACVSEYFPSPKVFLQALLQPFSHKDLIKTLACCQGAGAETPWQSNTEGCDREWHGTLNISIKYNRFKSVKSKSLDKTSCNFTLVCLGW